MALSSLGSQTHLSGSPHYWCSWSLIFYCLVRTPSTYSLAAQFVFKILYKYYLMKEALKQYKKFSWHHCRLANRLHKHFPCYENGKNFISKVRKVQGLSQGHRKILPDLRSELRSCWIPVLGLHHTMFFWVSFEYVQDAHSSERVTEFSWHREEWNERTEPVHIKDIPFPLTTIEFNTLFT